MSRIQLDRLRKDLEELNLYISKVKEKGKMDLVSKLNKKRDFLESKLEAA